MTLRALAATCSAAALLSGLLTGVGSSASAATGGTAADKPSTQSVGARAGISWGATTLTPESPSYAVSGRLKGKRKVLLQHKVARSWRTLDRAKSRKGAYILSGSWEWYGQHPVRVHAPRAKGRRSKTLGRTTFTVSPSVTPRGLPSEYQPFSSGGREFRFNPCRPIRWRFNSGGGAGDPLFGQVQGAVTEISRATGIEFRYVGTSQTIPINVSKLEKGTDLVVAFAGSAQVPAMGPATAVGGSVRTVEGRSGRRKVWRIDQAGVTINSDKLLSGGYSLEESSASPTAKLVFMHELGHAMGLDHVTTPGSETQVMFSGSTYMTPWDDGLHHPRWGAGDIAGLSHLGLASGCVR